MTAETESASSETFEILGHETRLAIIEELAKHRRTHWQPDGLGFAELRKAVDVEDAGKFNYHLDKLRDHFVAKYGDEYVLHNAGFQLAGAILAGTYTERTDTRRSETDRRCPVCTVQLEAIYEHGYLRVECADHGEMFAKTVPPGAATDRSMDELLTVADRDARHTLEHARGGVCPHCWGRMTNTMPADSAPLLDGRNGDDAEMEQVLVRFSCERCDMTFWFPASTLVLDHPAVVSLYDDHGIDIRDRDYLELDFVTDGNETIVSENPVRVAVAIEVGANTVRLTVDETLAVVDIELDSPPTTHS